MKKMKKIVALVLTVAIFASLCTGISLFVSAEVKNPLSASYAEASDLMTALGMMDNSSKEWTDPITAEEANDVIFKLFYEPLQKAAASYGQDWAFAHLENHDKTEFAHGETVTCAKLVGNAYAGCGFPDYLEPEMIPYFHLLKGLPDTVTVSSAENLTREQAAQIFLNVLKANTFYNPDCLKFQDTNLELQLISAGETSKHYPKYYWADKTGAALTAVYTDKPVLSCSGGLKWSELLGKLGVSENASNSGAKIAVATNDNGAGYGSMVVHALNDEDSVFKTEDAQLTFFDAYHMSYAKNDDGGLSSFVREYKVFVLSNTDGQSANYPEATALMMALEKMSSSNDSPWSDNISAEEGNKVITDLFFTPRGRTFADRPNAVPLSDSKPITVRSVALLALEGASYSGNDWISYFHVTKGLPANSIDSVCTREMAAQIFLNVLKVNPTYRGGYAPDDPSLDPNDDGNWIWAHHLGIKLIRDGVNADLAPMYHWEKDDGTPLTDSFADIPIAELTGGVTYFDTYETLGVIEGLKGIGFSFALRFTEDGTTYDDFEGHSYGETGYKTKKIGKNTEVLTIYDDYTMSGGYRGITGFCHDYDIVVVKGDTSISEEYEIAVTVMDQSMIMDTKVVNPLWKRPFYGKEANKALDTLYSAISNKEHSSVPKNWKSPFKNDQTITAREYLLQALNTIGWTYSDPDHWIAYLHLTRDITNYDPNMVLSREEAAQLTLNVLKAGLTYNGDMIKAKELGLEYRLDDVDELARPLYTWVKSGREITDSLPDTPLIRVRGGLTWNKLLNALDNGSSYQFTADFSISENGDEFSQFEAHKWDDENSGVTLYDKKWTIEVYVDYYPQDHEQQGYMIVATEKQYAEAMATTWYGMSDAAIGYYGNMSNSFKLYIDNEEVSSSNYDVDENEQFIILHEDYLSTLNIGKHNVKLSFSATDFATSTLNIVENGQIDTVYPEAVELMCNIGYMDKDNHNWQEAISAEEANMLLQKMYASVHFSTPWSYDYDRSEAVRGTSFVKKCMITNGWNYDPTDLWANYNNMFRGLLSDFYMGGILTREQAAQIALNTFKTESAYGDYCTLKAGDIWFKVEIVKVTTDEYGRPSYKWQKNGVDLTGVYQDSPVAKIRGGCSWSAVMTACGNPKKIGRNDYYCYNINGGPFFAYERRSHIENTFLSSEKMLEVYTDYINLHSQAYTFMILAIDTPLEHIKTPDIEVPEVGVKRTTMYPEAVELGCNVGYLNKDNDDWQAQITGDEANQILSWMYAGPGFIAKWEPGYTNRDKITGNDFISKTLVTIGWNYNNDKQWATYLHLEKGLKSNYNANKPLTREQAAQIILNALRSETTYNLVKAKYQDPHINLKLVKTGEDQYHRPRYKWQSGPLDLTKSYTDTPIAVLTGGISFNDIMTVIGDPASVNRVTGFRWSTDGGAWTDYVDKLHEEQPQIFMDNSTILELYFNYFKINEEQYIDVLCLKEGAASSIGLTGHELLEKKHNTLYPEAVELVCNAGIMDSENENWKEYITAKEANDALTIMYAGPGFIDPWEPGYTSDKQVTGESFFEKCLITAGWNYGRAPMFGEYNHLAKGISGFSLGKRLTREEAAQILLNTMKTKCTYNTATIKGNDPGLGLHLMKSGEDAQHRSYYKWQKNGMDITNSYPDVPVAVLRGGISVNEFLIAIGDVGDVNFPASCSFSRNGGPFSEYVDYQIPNFERLLDMSWILEVYEDYDQTHDEQGYRIICCSGATFSASNATWGGKGPVSISSPADMDEFMDVVTLNGYNIPKEYYKVSKGSTVVTLSEKYLRTLPAGNHVIGILSESGVAYGTLTIPETDENGDIITPMGAAVPSQTEETAPATEAIAGTEESTVESAESNEEVKQSSSAWIWIVAAVVVIGGAAAVLLSKKKAKKVQ